MLIKFFAPRTAADSRSVLCDAAMAKRGCFDLMDAKRRLKSRATGAGG